MNRRLFLQSLAAAATSSALPRFARAAPAPTPTVGVQLYTLRDDLAKDLPGTLAAVAKIGIRSVEAFPAVYTPRAADLRRMLDDNGLKCPSGHFNYDNLESGLDYAQELGLSYYVCSYLAEKQRTYEGFAQAADQLNAVGAKAKARGIQLAYHNHNFEFKPIAPPGGGAPTIGLDILLERTDPGLVRWEEDCYWVAQSGNDPLAFLKKHQDRVALLHLKDRLPDAKPNFMPEKNAHYFTEVGTGTIPWPPILKIARKTGALLFIEQDTTTLPALASLAISFHNVQKYL